MPEQIQILREISSRKLYVESLRANGTAQSEVIDCRLVRTLAVTARVTYNAAATGAVRVELRYSPDNSNWDTVDFTNWLIPLTAGSTVQITKVIDVPEWGFLQVRLTNTDSSYAATDCKVWVTVMKHSPKVSEIL